MRVARRGDLTHAEVAADLDISVESYSAAGSSTTVRKGRCGAGKPPGPAVHDDHVQRNFTAA